MMLRSPSISLTAPLLALVLVACFEDPTVTTSSGNQDGDDDAETSNDGDPSGDGDGDPSGDGDGDPSGDGDGDPSGDGDGDPSGDGDGDPSGDGDGDGDDDPVVYSFTDNLCSAAISSWTGGLPTTIACNTPGTPDEGWARSHASLTVENSVTFSPAVELATYLANDGLIQAVYTNVNLSSAVTPVLRARVGCSQLVNCSAAWEIVVREVGVPTPPLGSRFGVETNDGQFGVVEWDLSEHKSKLLEITLIMTNDDQFHSGDIIVFDHPRVVDAG